MSVLTAFLLWVFACWVVTIYLDQPLQPVQLQDDIPDVNTADLHRLREMDEADRREWANLGSDVVTRAQRMRHIRQAVRRG